MSDAFVGLINAGATVLVGSFAYGVYRKGKRDEKRTAARIILLEVEEAEQQLAKVSVENPIPSSDEQIKLMPVASWDRYKHLFINDFDRNETDKISDFYRRCAEYDKAAAFQIEVTFGLNQQELRINMQRVLADYARDYNDQLENRPQADHAKLEAEYAKRRDSFVQIYGSTSPTHMYTYVPMKPYDDAKRALNGIEQSLSLTSVGTKLKTICRSHLLLGRILDKMK